MKKYVVKVIRDTKIVSRLVPAHNEYDARNYSYNEVLSVEPFTGQKIEEDIQIVVRFKKGSLSNLD